MTVIVDVNSSRAYMKLLFQEITFPRATIGPCIGPRQTLYLVYIVLESLNFPLATGLKTEDGMILVSEISNSRGTLGASFNFPLRCHLLVKLDLYVFKLHCIPTVD